jgi:phospholipase C
LSVATTLLLAGCGGSPHPANNTTGTTSGGNPTQPPPSADVSAIRHVIFMQQENRTFDTYFGMLNPYRKAHGWNIGADGKDYEVDGIDDKLAQFSNANDQGQVFGLFKFKSTCIDDETSAWLESYGDINRYDFTSARGILLDGFVHTAEGYANSGVGSGEFTDTAGRRAMGYYDQDFLNYYYYMASQFAISDRWFSPIASKSIPNRIATFTGGTTEGLVRDPALDDHFPQLNAKTIFQELSDAGVSWKIYYTVTDDECMANADECSTTAPNKYPATVFSYFTYSRSFLYQNPSGAACAGNTQGSSVVGDPGNMFCIDTSHIAPLSQFFTDLNNGQLPSFAFIEAGYGINDEHPGSGQSILSGQAEMAKILDAFMTSPSWKDSVFFLSYDEGGGPFDHVPPVPDHTNQYTDSSLGITSDISSIAVNPDQYMPCLANGTVHCDLQATDPGANPTDVAAQKGFAAQLGFRLPNIVVSPFAKAHYVSHTPMDHTAVIKFVESRFIGSGAHLTARDAAQPDLLEFFDFTSVPWATPPTPPAPVSVQSLGYDPCLPRDMGP